MPSGTPIKTLWSSPSKVPGFSPSSSGLKAVNTTRQGRFEARSARRWGDWGILAIPTAMLWFDETLAVLDDDNGFLGPPMIDIWP